MKFKSVLRWQRLWRRTQLTYFSVGKGDRGLQREAICLTARGLHCKRKGMTWSSSSLKEASFNFPMFHSNNQSSDHRVTVLKHDSRKSDTSTVSYLCFQLDTSRIHTEATSNRRYAIDVAYRNSMHYNVKRSHRNDGSVTGDTCRKQLYFYIAERYI
jgi:hypothetical protein